MDMKSMKMSPAESKEYSEPMPGGAPVYPYGLCLNLDDDAIDKLGMVGMPEPGQTMMIQARVTVTGCRQEQRQDETHRSMDLQITDMAIGPDTAKPSAEDRLYSEPA
mgnify:CR=1 FL=1